MSEYKRPKLEDFLDDTIPPVGYFITEHFFERVTEATLEQVDKAAGRVVLDVASGMGIDSCKLARRGFDVIAMEPMGRMTGFSVKHHAEKGHYSSHLRAYAEEIPLRDESVDQVLCKGSLDHFIDPHAALDEMKRVLKPGGKIVAAVANYDSLSCKLSKFITDLQARLYPGIEQGRPHHEIPSDHVTCFDSEKFVTMLGRHFVIRKTLGIGMLWGTPYVNLLFDRLPRPTARVILNAIHRFAEGRPRWADMVLAVGAKPPLR